MLRNIIAVLAIVLCTDSRVWSQGLDEELLKLERLAYTTESDSVRNRIFFLKQDLYVRNGLFDGTVFLETKRVDHRMLQSSERIKYLWNSSLIAYLNEEYSYSKFYLRNYFEATSDSSVQFALLKLAVTSKDDLVLMMQQINELVRRDSSMAGLICLTSSYNYTRRHQTLYTIMSALIPGSGSMLQGEILKGGSSFIMNAAMAIGVSALISHGLYVNAVAWGLGLGLKFYSGNIKLTRVIHERKENEMKNLLTNECKEVFSEVLKKYPLSFK